MSDRPNIILLYSDQHRADVMGCAGHPDARTPNLDSLAEEGTQFTEHFCPYPVCVPSRMSLMTGQWLLLPVVALVPVAEAVSVILQVAYFKYTRRRFGQGRRLFKMSPVHHHFELLGWSETQVVQRFWLVGLLAAMAGVALALV